MIYELNRAEVFNSRVVAVQPTRMWVENECVFCNKLVDRIVTGHPHHSLHFDDVVQYFEEKIQHNKALIVVGG